MSKPDAFPSDLHASFAPSFSEGQSLRSPAHDTPVAPLMDSTASDKTSKQPVTLEDLLARPSAPQSPAFAQPVSAPNPASFSLWEQTNTPKETHKTVEVLQAQPVRPTPACADIDAHFLFVHAGTPASDKATVWIQKTLDGAPLHTARFQDSVNDQVLLLQPHVVFIHFDAAVLALATHLVEQLRTAHPHLTVVAVGKTSDANCTLAALRAGMQDFLDIDGAVQTARDAVRALIERTTPSITMPDAVAPLTAILSARAGQGCSVLASHMAYYLQQQLRKNNAQALPHTPSAEKTEADLDVLLLDLGLPAGDCSAYLNLAPGDFDFVQAVQNVRRFDAKLAASGLPQHASGLRLLSLPKNGDTTSVSDAYADLLLLRLRQIFKHVIADLGAIQSSALAQRMAVRANQIWLICEQTVPSVVSAAEQLVRLKKHNVDASRIQLLINKHDSRLELSAEQISQQLGLPIASTIAERRVQLSTAINRGELLEPEQIREPYVQSLTHLTQLLAAQHQLSTVAPSPKGLRRFFQRMRNA